MFFFFGGVLYKKGRFPLKGSVGRFSASINAVGAQSLEWVLGWIKEPSTNW